MYVRGPAGSVNGGGFFHDIGADEFDGVYLDLMKTYHHLCSFFIYVCYHSPNLDCYDYGPKAVFLSRG
ncbi:MAG: hypothetical protein IPG79_17095 [Saprospiraceae bacterium]|nr:hypothetical protein [Saprospiraceae bacterium]